MVAPTLTLPPINPPMGTPAAEWAQETVEAIDPNGPKGLVTDANGNPTTDHSKSALQGEPGHGMNSGKSAPLLDAQRGARLPVGNEVKQDDALGDGAGALQAKPAPRLYTNAQGNPTANSEENALANNPRTSGVFGSASDSVASTPGGQLPGGWVRGPESRQQSMLVPETSLYEDVSAAIDTVGQAAFSILPASVVGGLSGNREHGEANADSTQTKPAAPAPAETSGSPPRTSSPGLLSRAQGMLNGFLARPASPPSKLPVLNAPTTQGIDEAALVGGGAVAETANKLGDEIAAGQDLGGHDPKGVLEQDEHAKPEREGAKQIAPSGDVNTAARFMDPNVPTPDPSKPPQDPGVSGSVLPALANEGKKKSKGGNKGSMLSPDHDVQEAASKSDQDFSAPIPGTNSEDRKVPPSSVSKSQPASTRDGPRPIVTKVSDSGAKGILLNVKDVVAAPFAGSRAPQGSNEHSPTVTFGKDQVIPTSMDQCDKPGANPDGIRTTANPHTPHTKLPPTREEAREEHVGGTNVIAAVPGGNKAIKEVVIKEDENMASGAEIQQDGERIIIRGISTHGSGQGNIYVGADGGVSSRIAATAGDTSPPGSPSKSLSRLWSRSRRSTSMDEGTAGAATAAATTGNGALKATRSRFSEHEPPTGSESPSAPGSPSSARTKVPLKDKIKGEFKIISGKVSRNETKVEQGIALKTGNATMVEPVSPTTHKH